MTYQADCAIVLALLKVAFLGNGDDKRLGPWYGPLSSLPYLIADFSGALSREARAAEHHG